MFTHDHGERGTLTESATGKDWAAAVQYFSTVQMQHESSVGTVVDVWIDGRWGWSVSESDPLEVELAGWEALGMEGLLSLDDQIDQLEDLEGDEEG